MLKPYTVVSGEEVTNFLTFQFFEKYSGINVPVSLSNDII